MFSIRQMIELTGLSEFTIRGWENRYQAFSPERSDTGRREYSKKDVERALLLRELLKRGHKIGTIAGLNNQKLQTLFENVEESRAKTKVERKDKLVIDALELMALQKWTELSDLIRGVRYKTASDLIHQFFLPLLDELNRQINSGIVSIAQEHVLSSFLKEKIYSLLSELESKKRTEGLAKKVRIVLAAPEGDFHEIGLLLGHLLIRSFGYTSLFLGPHTPAQDLSETALRFQASHLLIVSTVSKKEGARHHLINYVSDVQKKMGPSVKIILAGPQAPPISVESNSALMNVASFHDFEQHLRALGGKV